MFKQLFSDNRLFIAVFCLLVFIAGGLLYLQVVKQEGRRAVQRTQEIVRQQQPPKTDSQPATPKPPPPGETAESGHWHGDVWHAEPHATERVDLPTGETPSANADSKQILIPIQPPDASSAGDLPLGDLSTAAAYQALREKYPDQTNNPYPFENVPVDLWDFEATKTAFMDNFNFYVAEGGNKPEVFNNSREVRIASAIMANIYNAAQPWFGLFTPEQCEEIKEMRRRYREFNGVKVNHDRVWELVHNEGYSVLEALHISREEGSN